jgi:hypothetical protein
LKIRDAICRKSRGQLARDTASSWQCHTPYSPSNPGQNSEIQWGLREHPPYSLDLVHNDFHLFCLLKNHLGGKNFSDDEETEMEVQKWLRQRSKDVHAVSFDTLTTRWGKCINVGGDISRNKCLLQVRISHVLCFISIYGLFTDSPS